MAHIGEEARFRLVGGFGALLRGLDFEFLFFARRHVAADADEVSEFAADGIVGRTGRGFDPHIMSVGVANAEAAGVGLAERRALDDLGCFVEIVGMDEREEAALFDLVDAALEHPLQRAGGEHDAAVRLVHQDDVGSFFRHQAVHLLRLFARFFGAHLLRHVVADAEKRR